jgi:hypothetical protein
VSDSDSIAYILFGWKDHPNPRIQTWVSTSQGRQIQYMKRDFTASVSNAWPIVDEMNLRGYALKLTAAGMFNQAVFIPMDIAGDAVKMLEYSNIRCIESTAAEAICSAALAAIKKEKD